MMEIKNEAHLEKAAQQAGMILQAIHDYCASHDMPRGYVRAAQVRFPRGFIRPASLQRTRLPFVADKDLRSNIAYTMILSDAVLWLSLRTDLWGTPREMLVKLYVFLLGTICESITKDYLKGICGKNYKGRTAYLSDAGIINRRLQKDLDWLWDTRNRMHLFQLAETEYENAYDNTCHARSVRAFRGLISALAEHGRL